MLQIENIDKRFGGITALDNVSMDIKQNQIYGVIGPNGAGKSTLFKVISGVLKPDEGRVVYKDKNITGLHSYQISRLGIGYVFQDTFLFGSMTLFENMLVSGSIGLNNGLLSLLPFYQYEKERRFRKKVDKILKIFNLDEKTDLFPDQLAYGERRRALIAHVLINGGSLLLLDEPSAGMNASEREDLSRDILRIREDGHTILIIEHNLRLIMGICDHISVLNFGKMIGEGTPEVIANNKEVVAAYIGRKSG